MAIIGISDFNETYEFEEYNPHPYKGGYDIALTYGNPLPPLPAICYPYSSSSSDPPAPDPELPLPSLPGASPEPNRGPFSPYGERGFESPDCCWDLLGVFPPWMANDVGAWGFDAEDLRYWSQLRRAADYIFGHSQGFGERRVGVDAYGIPIYACKMGGGDAVKAEIQPEKTQRLEYHSDDSITWPSSYNNSKDESSQLDSSLHAYMKHHFKEPIHTELDPVESVFSWKFSHHELYENQGHLERKLVPLCYSGEGGNELNLCGDPKISYDTHFFEGSQNVQLEAINSSFQNLSSHEVFQDSSYTDSYWEQFYPYGIHCDERNAFTDAYNGCDRMVYKQPSDTELEPYKPTWAQYQGYYEISEEEINYSSQPFQKTEHYEALDEASSPTSAWVNSNANYFNW